MPDVPTPGSPISRSLLLGLPMLLLGSLLMGCGGTPADVVSGSDVEYVICDSPTESWTDLTDEPAGWRGRSGPLVNWTDDAGCAIRLDALFHTFGDDHCDWEKAEFISLGLPVGTPFSGPDADPPEQDWAPLFFFNGDGAVQSWPDGDRLDASDVPDDAADIGATTATGRRLRLAADELTLYEIQGDNARAFVQIGGDDILCA